METDNNKSRSDVPYKEKKEQGNVPKPPAKPASKPVVGETMRDSMTETAPNNDNTKIPEAEQLTDEHGKLDAEAFKRSYQGNKGEKPEKK